MAFPEPRPVLSFPSGAPASASDTLTYEPFFGLAEKPFSLNADLRFHFDSPSHAASLKKLLDGIRRREGLIVLTGEMGTGKTMLCRAALVRLNKKPFSSFVPDPFAAREDLLKTMLLDFGVVSITDLASGSLRGASRTELSYLLAGFLQSPAASEGYAIVVIDEAQNLSPPMIEETRILQDSLGAEGRLQILLVGQMELHEKLKAPEMRQVDQRITSYTRLDPLSPEMVGKYIEHRLKVAGFKGDRILFPPDVVDVIHRRTGGVPRLVNRLCDSALSVAHTRASHVVDRACLDAALDAIGSETFMPTWASIVYSEHGGDMVSEEAGVEVEPDTLVDADEPSVDEDLVAHAEPGRRPVIDLDDFLAQLDGWAGPSTPAERAVIEAAQQATAPAPKVPEKFPARPAAAAAPSITPAPVLPVAPVVPVSIETAPPTPTANEPVAATPAEVAPVEAAPAETTAPVETVPVETALVQEPPVEAPAEAPTVEAAPFEAALVEAAPVEAAPLEVAPADAAAVEAQTIEAAPIEAEVAVEVALVESPPAESLPVEVAPADSALVEAPAVEALPVDAASAAAPTAEAAPVEAAPVGAPPVEATAAEVPTVEAAPVEAALAEMLHVEAAPVEPALVVAALIEEALEAAPVEAPAVEAAADEAPTPVAEPAVEMATPAVMAAVNVFATETVAPELESDATSKPADVPQVIPPAIVSKIVETVVEPMPVVPSPAIAAAPEMPKVRPPVTLDSIDERLSAFDEQAEEGDASPSFKSAETSPTEKPVADTLQTPLLAETPSLATAARPLRLDSPSRPHARPLVTARTLPVTEPASWKRRVAIGGGLFAAASIVGYLLFGGPAGPDAAIEPVAASTAIPAPAGDAAPAPADTPPVAAASASTGTAAPAAAQAAVAPPAPRVARPAASAQNQDFAPGTFLVAVGLYVSDAYANRVASKLIANELPAVKRNIEVRGTAYMQVVLGPFTSRARANDALEILQTDPDFEDARVVQVQAPQP